MLITARAIQKSYSLRDKQIVALDSVTFDVEKGEVIVLIGPSGSGKSTLLRCLNGLALIDEGTLVVDGIAVNKQARAKELNLLRQRVGMVFQQFHLFSDKTLLQNVTMAPRIIKGTQPNIAETEAMVLLERVGLADKAHALPVQLSGGQQQRGAIARALAMHPDILLFDEPTSALDPEMVEEVQNVIQGLTQAGLTMIIVTHELAFAKKVASRIWFCDKGQIIEDAPASDFFKQPRHARAQQFLASSC